MKTTETHISCVLYDYLKDLGAIQWHKSASNSFYIKFRDVRLGSIRIANHRGRRKYHYTYEIYVHDKDIERKIDDIVKSIKKKAETIPDFDSKKYVVFNRDLWKYVVVDCFEDYQKSIWNK